MSDKESCDHIIGFGYSPFPQHGDRDYLVNASDGEPADEPFAYCPKCGASLVEDKPS